MLGSYTVYQHVTPDGMYYFGVTRRDINVRWRKSQYKNTSLEPYIDKYGWENIGHYVLFTNQTYQNSLFIEDFLINTARMDGVCINKQRSGLVTKNEDYQKGVSSEWYEKHKEQRRKHYQENRKEMDEKSKKYKKKWYDKHYNERKDELNERRRKYRLEHLDEIREKERVYRNKYRKNKREGVV